LRDGSGKSAQRSGQFRELFANALRKFLRCVQEIAASDNPSLVDQ
jgi:hypothetical protein